MASAKATATAIEPAAAATMAVESQPPAAQMQGFVLVTSGTTDDIDPDQTMEPAAADESQAPADDESQPPAAHIMGPAAADDSQPPAAQIMVPAAAAVKAEDSQVAGVSLGVGHGIGRQPLGRSDY